MSGLPHPFDAPLGHDSKPVTHIIDWREDGVATVQWCGKKYLSDPVVLKKGETKPCPVCAIELRYDRQKKEVVEGGFPCVPNRTGGQTDAAQPVAWRWYIEGQTGGWHYSNVRITQSGKRQVIEPLYAHPEDAPEGPTTGTSVPTEGT